MKMKKMTVKELIDKIDLGTKENLWDIIINGGFYDENKTQTLNTEVESWGLEYCLVNRSFKLFLIIHTVNYEPKFFKE